MFLYTIQYFLNRLWKIENDTFSMLAVFLLALCVVRFIQFYMELKALPPGPWGVPILGLLPTLSGIRAPYLHYLELKQKYGPLFSMKVGSQLHVIMTDYKLIRDTFRKDEFSGRPQGPFHDLLSGYGKRKNNNNKNKIQL